ncbi:TPA: hypothetical protein I8Y22_002086 [Raoultella planticola]|nr:hypothetical protein [Raoultella planticola]
MIIFTYVGVTAVFKCLLFPAILEYSTGYVILSFSAVVLGPVFISGFPVIFLGRRFEDKISSALNKIIIGGFVMAVFSGVVFRAYYLDKIKSQGYIECHSSSVGIFSALSKKYSLTLSGCEQ